MVAEKKGISDRQFWSIFVVLMSVPYFVDFPSFVEKLGLVVAVLQYIVLYMPYFYFLVRELLSFESMQPRKRIVYAVMFSVLLVATGLLEAKMMPIPQLTVVVTRYTVIMAIGLPTIEFLAIKMGNKRH